ncbi:MAG: DUF1700 domain-containing protein [Coriobacteriia bacterium]|nr:DUF1700 domain-containing protein [Coriobacteriia bacterium]
MNKTEFLEQLRRKLKNLPPDEVNEALSYYEEYFSDAGPENEAATIAELGSPAEVAAGIISDYAIKDVSGDEGKKSTGSSLSVIWIVILGIFASPIALPLAIAAVAVIMVLLISVFAVFLSLAASAIALIASGLVALICGVVVMFQSFASGIFFIGTGLVTIALGGALGLFIVWLTKITVRGIALLGARLLKKRGA